MGKGSALDLDVPIKRAMKRSSTASISGSYTGTSKLNRICLRPSIKDGSKNSVFTFGEGDVGQLGLGPDIESRSKPTRLPDLGNVVEICAGGMHTVCLTDKGKVYTFGCNDDGALGRPTTEEGSEFTPGEVVLPASAVQISAGDSHSAALLEDGKVYSWGSFRDSTGVMGLTITGIQKIPCEILPNVFVTKICSGTDHLVLLSDKGEVFSCGCGEQGQLGRVSSRSSGRSNLRNISRLFVPSVIHLRKRVDEIWAGNYCTYIRVKSTQSIYVFGLNNYNQLGINDIQVQYHPAISQSFSDKKWKQICGGQHHTIALDEDGVTYAVGRKEYGRLGLGEDSEDALEPTVIPALRDKKCVHVACGSVVSFAVTEDGEVYGWGMGTNNQLGLGDDSDMYEPHLIKGKQMESFKTLRVSGGGQHTIILASQD